MHKHLLVIFFLGIALSINAQKALKGKLIASDSKKPISGASVFLSNTSKGTFSSDDGSFIINSFPEGRYDLLYLYWVWPEKLSNLLPLDYQIPTKKK